MPITIPALSSPSFSFNRHAPLSKFSPFSHSPVRIGNALISNPSLPTKTLACNPQCRLDYNGISGKIHRISLGRYLRVSANARDNEGEVNNEVRGGFRIDFDQAEKEARAQSTMPERFRYLTKEAPDLPVRWPWFVG